MIVTQQNIRLKIKKGRMTATAETYDRDVFDSYKNTMTQGKPHGRLQCFTIFTSFARFPFQILFSDVRIRKLKGKIKYWVTSLRNAKLRTICLIVWFKYHHLVNVLRSNTALIYLQSALWKLFPNCKHLVSQQLKLG